MTRAFTAVLLLGALAAVPAAAENESAKDAFKHTERGMGRLLESMGSEIRKIGAPEKKGEKTKPAAPKDKQK